MARWEPDARPRLLAAALDLFAEQGYEATTTAQIAERAGLTKTTFFRLFTDKREIAFSGQAASIERIASAIAAAPSRATPHELLAAALEALAAAHIDEHRETGRRLEPIVAASAELRERSAFKRAAIGAALEKALASRMRDRREAGVLADRGIRAYYTGFARWTEAGDDRSLAHHVRRELGALERAAERVG